MLIYLMLKAYLLLCFMIFFNNSISSSNRFIASDFFLSQSAEDKLRIIWSKIMENTSPADWFSALKIIQLTLPWYDLDASFDYRYDIMPSDRDKLIHSQGIVSKVNVKITKSLHTGVLNSGCKNAILRLSVAKETKLKDKSPHGAYGNFVPGMALKCFINGLESVNLVAMYDTSGQYSYNFFKHPFTNSFPISEPSDYPLKLLAGAFTKVSKYVSSVGVSNWTEVDEQGNSQSNVNYPFRLEFVPTEKAQNLFRDEYTEDFKKIIMNGLKKDSVIYDIISHRVGYAPEKIGEIVTTSDFTTSYYADRVLFFRHQRIAEDDSKNGYNKYRDSYDTKTGIHKGEKVPEPTKCPFGYN